MKGKPIRPVAEAPKVEIDARGDERIRILDGTVKRLKVVVKDLQEEVQKKGSRDHPAPGKGEENPVAAGPGVQARN